MTIKVSISDQTSVSFAAPQAVTAVTAVKPLQTVKVAGVIGGAAAAAGDLPDLPTGRIFIGTASGTDESVYTLPSADGTSGQVLKTDGSGAVSFGDMALESGISITNNDAAFGHMTSSISAGTTFETILRNILEKYNRTTITLQNIRVQLEPLSGDDSYGSEQTLTTGQSLEVGRKLKVNGFRALVGDSSQTIDDSVAFLQGSTVIESGFSDGNQAKTLATPYEVSPSTAASYSFKVRVTDDGGPNLGDEDITSTSKTFTYKYLAKLGASSTSAIADDAAAQTLYDGITEQASALVNSSSWNNVDTTADGNSQSNYTYIIYPATFGALQNVVQDNALSVLSAFTDLGDFTINNTFGASISYSFYRTNQTAAFSTGTELDITF